MMIINISFSPRSSPMSCFLSCLKTNKGKPLLVYNQYTFKFNQKSSSKKYWLCTEHGCGVYMHTDLNNEFLSITSDHNHVANPDILEIKSIKDKMKERILAETTSITKIYDEEVAKAHLSEEGAAALPTVIEYRTCFIKNG